MLRYLLARPGWRAYVHNWTERETWTNVWRRCEIETNFTSTAAAYYAYFSIPYECDTNDYRKRQSTKLYIVYFVECYRMNSLWASLLPFHVTQLPSHTLRAGVEQRRAGHDNPSSGEASAVLDGVDLIWRQVQNYQYRVCILTVDLWFELW